MRRQVTNPEGGDKWQTFRRNLIDYINNNYDFGDDYEYTAEFLNDIVRDFYDYVPEELQFSYESGYDESYITASLRMQLIKGGKRKYTIMLDWDFRAYYGNGGQMADEFINIAKEAEKVVLAINGPKKDFTYFK